MYDEDTLKGLNDIQIQLSNIEHRLSSVTLPTINNVNHQNTPLINHETIKLLIIVVGLVALMYTLTKKKERRLSLSIKSPFTFVLLKQYQQVKRIWLF